MHKINFVDTTFRDAHASLWGEKMSTAMMLQIAPEMERAGFKAMDATAISHLEFAVRHFRENPWERLRLISKVIKRTPLSIMVLGNSLTVTPWIRGPIIRLWMERCFANGIRRVQTMESSNNMRDIAESVKYAKDVGLYVVAALIYSHSPVHTDEHYAERARDTVNLGVDAVYLKDPGGLLTPERIRTLVPAIQKNIGDLPLELHSHCTTGLAPLCYLEAIELGVDTVHTAISPLANGPSQPSTENILANIKNLGYPAGLDEEALKNIATHFRYVAKREGLPIGAPLEYDNYQFMHQVPGGVISNLKRQLSEIGNLHRLDEVIEEIVHVRRELGYPIMVTPFSQWVATQATLNVMLGERYKEVLDEVIRFTLGKYGPPPGSFDQNFLDRIMGLPKAKEFSDWSVPSPSIEELRQRFGAGISDEELLLCVLCKAEDIQAMKAAGPIKTYYPTGEEPIVTLIQRLLANKKMGYISVKKGDFTLRVQRGGNRTRKE